MNQRSKVRPGIRHPLQSLLEGIHAQFKDCCTGAVADYIPELAKADPQDFGVALALPDGFIYEVGDSRALFTIQSISKPLVYALALQDHGREEVIRRIGVEPSGEAFNSITFDERNNRPFNPMVNAGAIAASSLILGGSVEERFTRILDFLSTFVGRQLDVDEAVYRSEAATGHRNRAIAYLELNSGMIDMPVDDHLALYFRQCAIRVSARDLAIIAATFANGGLHPLTGLRVVSTDLARDVLSVMATCGMYDYAGAWQFDVGLPAKSGVGGGIMAVLPSQLGLGIFSPPLDETGNSWRGIKVCEALSRNLKLHLLDHRGQRPSALRRAYRVRDVRSSRARCAEAMRVLDEKGSRLAVYEVQGFLSFADTEQLTRIFVREMDQVDEIIIDARRVLACDRAGLALLARGINALVESDRRVSVAFVSSSEINGDFRDRVQTAGAHTGAFDTLLEDAEDRLVAEHLGELAPDARIDLASFDSLSDLSPDEIDRLQAHLTPADFDTGCLVVAHGAPADSLFFLVRGRPDVEIRQGSDEGRHRIGSIEAGNMFGEAALISHGRRTADVVAATPAECLALTREGLQRLQEAHPMLANKLMMAVGRVLAGRLARANVAIAALA